MPLIHALAGLPWKRVLCGSRTNETTQTTQRTRKTTSPIRTRFFMGALLAGGGRMTRNSPQFERINHQQKGNNMADYFTNFSLVLKLANEAEQAYALDLAHKASLAQQGDELPADFPKVLVDMVEDWHFETDADNSGTMHGLWLHSMNGGVDAVCAFIQHLLQKFDEKGYVTFEWSQ